MRLPQLPSKWVVVKIMVPVKVLSIIRHQISKVPKKIILTTTQVGFADPSENMYRDFDPNHVRTLGNWGMLPK